MDDFEDSDLDFDRLTEVLKKSTGTEAGERRKKANWTGKVENIFALIALGLILAIPAVLYLAAPDKNYGWLTFFDEYETWMINRKWDYALVYTAYIMFLISLGICAIASVFNRFRKRRRMDKQKISIYVIGGINVIGFVAFLIYFGNILFVW